MGRVCAYCGGSEKLTREHLWPAGIIKRVEYSMRYTEKAGKFFDADMVIADVCSVCNNGVLSQLDNYICNLHDNFFSEFFIKHESEKIVFEYDYYMLTRWLLKISYNSARMAGENVRLMESFVPYIMGNTRELEDMVSFRLELVPTANLAEIKSDSINSFSITPSSARCGRILLSGITDDWCILRFVAINSFYFFIVITPHKLVVAENEIERLVNFLPQNILFPENRTITLYPSTRDAVTWHTPWLVRNKSSAEAYIKTGTGNNRKSKPKKKKKR